MRQNSANVLLVKDDVGKSKRSTRDLPAEGHTFGLRGPRDPVGVSARKLLENLSFCSDI